MAQGSGVVILVLAAGLAAVYYGIRRYFAGAVCKSKAMLKGKTILITGANTGLGKATALDLAKREARVILACRSLQKGHKAAEEIRSVVRGAVLVVMHLDLSSLASVRKFAEEFSSVEGKLDILINNAGVYMDSPQATTQDGFELHFGVNHLGHFLLTNLLLDLLERSSPSRIVIVSSSLAKRARIDFDNIYGEKGYMGKQDRMGGPYAQSKLANLLFAHELNKRLPEKVTVNSLCPGICWTHLHRNSELSFMKKLLLYPIAMLVAKRPWEGSQTIIYCASEESLQTVSGQIFVDCCIKEFPPHTRDDGVARKLWELSETLTQLNQSSNSL